MIFKARLLNMFTRLAPAALGVLSSLSLLITASNAYAQSITVESLNAASAYDGGLLDPTTGGLDASLWQGTSAPLAVSVIEAAPLQSGNVIIRDLVKAALLSGGIPPQSKTQSEKTTFDHVRLMSVAKMGHAESTRTLVTRLPELIRDNTLKVEMDLLSGDIQSACAVTDNVSEGRATPKWARVRAFCHITRDEIAAAELTTDLLRQSEYDDPTFYGVMDVLLGVSTPMKTSQTLVFDEALDIVMADMAEIRVGIGPLSPYLAVKRAIDLERSDNERLEALFDGSPFMTDAQISTVLKGFANAETNMAGESESAERSALETQAYDLESAMKAPAPRALGQLYSLALEGSTSEIKAKAITAYLDRVEKVGKFDRFAILVDRQAQQIPYDEQARIGLRNFAQLSVNRGDLGALQSLYRSIEADTPQQARMALVSDALGNGFFGGGLGRDIEDRLFGASASDEAVKARALRDSYIALAMGASLSADVSKELTRAGRGAGKAAKAGALIALHSAARRGSRAETALRTATLLAPGRPKDLDAATLASVISALRIAGLDSYAGRIAAEDFLSGL